MGGSMTCKYIGNIIIFQCIKVKKSRQSFQKKMEILDESHCKIKLPQTNVFLHKFENDASKLTLDFIKKPFETHSTLYVP